MGLRTGHRLNYFTVLFNCVIVRIARKRFVKYILVILVYIHRVCVYTHPYTLIRIGVLYININNKIIKKKRKELRL